jgi:isoquinoline 1-oxidoreductase beta subunit
VLETMLTDLAHNHCQQVFFEGTVLLVGFALATSEENDPQAPENDGRNIAFAPNAWIRISRDNTVTVIVGQSEMGQGVLTALSQIVADELEADWQTVRYESAPADRVYKNPVMGSQMTVGSMSISSFYKPLRKAAAEARQILVETAASHWWVPVSECNASEGRVLHKVSERTMTYGEIVDHGIKSKKTVEAHFKHHEGLGIVGKRIRRLDTPDKATGKAVFGIDVQAPDLLAATVIHAPAIGAKLKSYDSTRALDLPGVRKVFPIPGGLAVVADTFWQAKIGASSVELEWDEDSRLSLSSEDIWSRWRVLANQRGKRLRNDGNALRKISVAPQVIEASYELPFQAHACAEPMNCTAHVQSHRCDVWAPTQTQGMAQFVAATISGLPIAKVHVHTTFMGGAFGRRVADLVAEATTISKAIGRPVKVIWTREEDMRNDLFRPASYHLLKAVIDKDGLPDAWFHRVVGPPTFEGFFEAAVPAILPDWVPKIVRSSLAKPGQRFIRQFYTPKLAVEGAANIAYDIENVRVEYVRDDPGIPVGPWRSVDYSTNTFAVESFMDEIAAASGRDPLDLRLQLLKRSPELTRVLSLAAEKAGWGTPTQMGATRGLSVHNFHGTAVATVAEVSIDSSGRIKVPRVVCAVDCGTVVNPRIVEQQISGGIAFGLTATLKSAVTIRDGRVEQINLDSFPLLNMNEMPEVDVLIVPSSRRPSGIGEVSVPGIAPAVCNAVFAATGKRFRSLPLDSVLTDYPAGQSFQQ